MHRYTAVIEREDGSTFTQDYDEFEDLVELRDALGDEYKIVEIY